MMLRRHFVLALAATLLVACAPQPRLDARAPASPVASTAQRPSAAVAMPDRYSAEVASRVLADGGNAVDAAVAAAFALAVTFPEAGNIGGGGFMLAQVQGQSVFLDYRETAPAAATRDMFLDARGEVVPRASLVGHRAVGVPGTVAGLWEAHRRYGTRPWSTLVQPAIELAERGFAVPAKLEANARSVAPRFAAATNFERYFAALQAGSTLRQPELAAVLRRIAAEGSEGFYGGETAALIVAEMQRGGGLVSAADLAAYRPVWREPLRMRWRSYEVVSAPPPSSGGIALLQLLRMKDLLAPEFAGEALNSPQYVHLTAEMDKRVFADRAEYLGDPGFVDVPVQRLLDAGYLSARVAGIDRQSISALASVPPGLEPRDTTHFSIVDHAGNAVANTYTLNTSFGSGVVVEGGGFLLNNEMDDFSVKPGTPNFFGVTGSSANAVQPGKRMLSSMTPTMLLEDGKVALVVGTPGGSTIVTTIYQAIVNVLDFGLSAAEAVGASRFHHQLLPPDLVTYSPGRPLPAATIEALRARGYRLEPHDYEYGDLQLVLRTREGWQAASDPRGRGESRLLSAGPLVR